MNININQDLDLTTLTSELKKHNRLQIDDFLEIESSEAILDTLMNATAWHLVHSDQQGLPQQYDPDELASLSVEQLKSLHKDVLLRATGRYQYMYKHFPIIDAMQADILPESSMLSQLGNFFNSTEFIGLGRKLTGVDSLVKSDPQATLYEPGHFLSLHDDSNYQRSKEDSSTRRFAFVLNLTKNWSPNWGGQTSFFDDPTASKSSSWYPKFNTLNIFQVPTLHSVNFVAPYAGKGRYSITGWLRDDPAIKRPDLGDV